MASHSFRHFHRFGSLSSRQWSCVLHYLNKSNSPERLVGFAHCSRIFNGRDIITSILYPTVDNYRSFLFSLCTLFFPGLSYIILYTIILSYMFLYTNIRIVWFGRQCSHESCHGHCSIGGDVIENSMLTKISTISL